MGVLNPLTDKHCEQIDTVLQQCPHIRDTIEAIKRCGIDMSQQEAVLQAQQEACQAIKREFNPLAN